MATTPNDLATRPKDDDVRSSAIVRWARALDFESRPEAPEAVWLRIAAWAAALFLLWRLLATLVSPLLSAHRPTPLGPGSPELGYRWGMPDALRHEIFTELATIELAERKRAIEGNTWGGHLWSREDDRGHREMNGARSLAERHHLSLTQVYLVLDEGIREHWPAPDGKPLPATTPPQDPRSTW